jgi:hypothetical protein
MALMLAFFFSTFLQAEDKEAFLATVTKKNRSKKNLILSFQDDNIRFFKRYDEVFLEHEIHSNYQCRATVEFGTKKELLLKVSSFDECNKNIGLIEGSSIVVKSFNLKENLKMASEVVSVLLKKRFIWQSKIDRLKREMTMENEKIALVKEEFLAKVKALELAKESKIQEVKNQSDEAKKQIADAEIKLLNIDKKLDLYTPTDQKIEDTKWSLEYSGLEK